MSVTTIRFLLTVAIQALKLVRWYYSQLSPGQKTEINEALAAWKKQIAEMPMIDDLLDPTHGMGGR